mgnify:CR=1 FL=1
MAIECTECPEHAAICCPDCGKDYYLRDTDAQAVVNRMRTEAAQMLAEADHEYNRKTNDLIERHAEQIARLTAELGFASLNNRELRTLSDQLASEVSRSRAAGVIEGLRLAAEIAEHERDYAGRDQDGEYYCGEEAAIWGGQIANGIAGALLSRAKDMEAGNG